MPVTHLASAAAANGPPSALDVSPSSGSLLVVGVGFEQQGDLTVSASVGERITCTASGLTFTRQVANPAYSFTADWGAGCALFTAPVATGGTYSVSIGLSGSPSPWHGSLIALEVTGHDAADPVGLTGGYESHASEDGSLSVPLGGTTASDSAVVGFVFSKELGSNVPVPSSGWTTLDDQYDAYHSQAITRTGALSSVAWDTVNSNLLRVAVAIEIKAAPSGNPEITGDLVVTEDPDAFAAEGSSSIAGDLVATEDTDSFAAEGSSSIVGSLVIAEDVDTFVAEGSSSISGDLAANEDADSFAAEGSVATTGGLAVTEDADAVALNGTVSIGGVLVIDEDGDAFEATGSLGGQSALVITEEPDTFSASGTVSAIGDLAVAEEPDQVTMGGAPAVTGALEVAEEPDTFLATGGPIQGVTGDLVIVELPDAFVANGGSVIFGALTILEDEDEFTSGVIPINPGIITATVGPRISINAAVGAVGSEVGVGPRIRITA